MVDPHPAVPHASPTPDSARVDAHCKAGTVLRQLGQLNQAVRVFAEALHMDPRHRPSLLALGATLSELRRWDGARRVYEWAACLFPDDAEARAGLRQALRELNAKEEAEEEPSGVQALPPAPDSGLLPPQSAPRRSPRLSGARLRERARLIGLPVSLLVIGTHVVVGLGTGMLFAGVSAAALAALVLATGGSLLFPRPGKRFVFWGLLQGIALGVGAAVLLMLALTAVAWTGHDHHGT
ncbi:MAG: tetratricopeptide repeat protein [Gemmatimonadota bacterium]|nr:tetratricopeptide repeat protein [Gemmatimonadota bacterium]